MVVVAAVVERHGRFLVTQRSSDVHLGGYWEFPGGKCEEGESLEDALRREMREELGVEIRIGQPLQRIHHRYPDHAVELHFYRCDILGSPRACLAQTLRWVTRSELAELPFPPADAVLIGILTTLPGKR